MCEKDKHVLDGLFLGGGTYEPVVEIWEYFFLHLS